MFDSPVPIDPELQQGLSLMVKAIENLMTPEELDVRMQRYRVTQVKNQYEYLLMIDSVMQDARLYHLQVTLESRKRQMTQAAFHESANHLAQIVLEKNEVRSTRVVDAGFKLDALICRSDAMLDPQLREVAQASLREGFMRLRDWLNEVDQADIQMIRSFIERLH